MTGRQFVEELQGYYSLQYTRGQLVQIKTWTDHHEGILEAVFKVVLKSFSGQFGRLPDIAIFEAAKKEVADDTGLKITNKILEQRKLLGEETLSPTQQVELEKILDDLVAGMRAKRSV